MHTSKPGAARGSAAQFAEICALARAINLAIAHAETVRLARIAPATYLSGAHCARLRAQAEAVRAELLVIDATLSPTQQRNLEKRLNLKVLDRTGLILEIFGARAQTREGRLQVEHAHLSYQRSRLVRSWTHLERQRGGLGFVGGPGETQIEADRRMIDARILRLEKRLERVRKRRAVQRKARARAVPLVALVGYTNAGKSTLFNLLTKADILAANMLFATLDPAMRAVRLPSGMRVVLSDTVGFIADLPTQLIAAFRATLEEVVAADLILHVRDASHADSEAQKTDVLAVLESLELAPDVPMLDVMNKCDQLTPAARQVAQKRARRRETPQLFVSATSGEGVDALCAQIAAQLQRGYQRLSCELGAGDAAALAWLHAHGTIDERRASASGITRLSVRLSEENIGKFLKKFKLKPSQFELLH